MSLREKCYVNGCVVSLSEAVIKTYLAVVAADKQVVHEAQERFDTQVCESRHSSFSDMIRIGNEFLFVITTTVDMYL